MFSLLTLCCRCGFIDFIVLYGKSNWVHICSPPCVDKQCFKSHGRQSLLASVVICGRIWYCRHLKPFALSTSTIFINFPLLRIFELQPFAFAFDTVRWKGCFVSDGHTEWPLYNYIKNKNTIYCILFGFGLVHGRLGSDITKVKSPWFLEKIRQAWRHVNLMPQIFEGCGPALRLTTDRGAPQSNSTKGVGQSVPA